MAGKKGRVMERRILKDFQIGLVEGIVNEVLVKAHEPKDVFSQIAKAIGTRSSNKGKNWNEIVRKNTVVRDPIGSTQASFRRRERRSLRRQIIESANKGLDMNTDKLVEYNPKLSEVSQSTRVAYVKFMSKKMRKDDHLDTIILENEEKDHKESAEAETVAKPAEGAFDALVKKASIVRRESEEALKVQATTTATSPAPEPEEPATKEDKDSKDFRCRTPIPEDPNEDRVMSPEIIGEGIDSKRSSLVDSPQSPELLPPPSSVKSDSPRAATPIASPISKSPIEPEKTTASTPTISPAPLNIQKDTLSPSPAAVASSSSRPVTPVISITPSKGKSAVSGRTMDGWI